MSDMIPSICGQNSIFVPTADPCTNCEHLEEELRKALKDMQDEVDAMQQSIEDAVQDASDAKDMAQDASDAVQSIPTYVVNAYPIPGETELSASWLSETQGGSSLTPQSGTIYILLDDSTTYTENTMFRWTGTSYAQVGGNNGSEYTLITNPQIDSLF